MSDQDKKPSDWELPDETDSKANAWDTSAHPAPLPVKKTVTPHPLPGAVRVVDIDIPFGSMIVLMVKWVIAAIPAFIILFVLFTLVGMSSRPRTPRLAMTSTG